MRRAANVIRALAGFTAVITFAGAVSFGMDGRVGYSVFWFTLSAVNVGVFFLQTWLIREIG